MVLVWEASLFERPIESICAVLSCHVARRAGGILRDIACDRSSAAVAALAARDVAGLSGDRHRYEGGRGRRRIAPRARRPVHDHRQSSGRDCPLQSLAELAGPRSEKDRLEPAWRYSQLSWIRRPGRRFVRILARSGNGTSNILSLPATGKGWMRRTSPSTHAKLSPVASKQAARASPRLKRCTSSRFTIASATPTGPSPRGRLAAQINNDPR
jgi:hypothetical protein